MAQIASVLSTEEKKDLKNVVNIIEGVIDDLSQSTRKVLFCMLPPSSPRVRKAVEEVFSERRAHVKLSPIGNFGFNDVLAVLVP